MIKASNNPGVCLYCGRITWNVSTEHMNHVCSEKCEKLIEEELNSRK